jgi:hypothetical protein
MLWYRRTDEWARKDQHHPPGPGRLVPKSGTKWHLVDPSRSDTVTVFALCDRQGYLKEKRVEALFEEATKAKPGMTIPTPGKGMNSACSFCFRIAVRLAQGG